VVKIVYRERAAPPFKIRQVGFQIPTRKRRPALICHTTVIRESMLAVENGSRLSKRQRRAVGLKIVYVFHLASSIDAEHLA
jgi:hypothetical protein